MFHDVCNWNAPDNGFSTGPQRISGHTKRPDTRAIEAPCRQNVRKSPCKTRGIHTRPSQRCRTNLEAALSEVDRENVDVGHLLLLLQRDIAPVWHHTMPGEAGIHPISSIPPRESIPPTRWYESHTARR